MDPDPLAHVNADPHWYKMRILERLTYGMKWDCKLNGNQESLTGHANFNFHDWETHLFYLIPKSLGYARIFEKKRSTSMITCKCEIKFWTYKQVWIIPFLNSLYPVMHLDINDKK
jgi:hypothetical protein